MNFFSEAAVVFARKWNSMYKIAQDEFKENEHPRDSDGKFSISQGSKNIKRVSDLITNTGGASYSVTSRKFPKKGFILSVNPECEEVHDIAGTTEEQRTKLVYNFIVKHKETLKGEDKHFGAWIDTDDNRLYFDVSTIVQDRHEAHELRKKHNQIALFNLSTGKEEREE